MILSVPLRCHVLVWQPPGLLQALPVHTGQLKQPGERASALFLWPYALWQFSSPASSELETFSLFCLQRPRTEPGRVSAETGQAWFGFDSPPSAWLVYSAFIYHLVAGIRHLLMDFGVGHTLEGAKRGSIAVLVVSGFLMVAGAIWFW